MMTATRPRVFAVVLTRNGAEEATACVEAARASAGVPLDFAIVDNGSTDGSAERLAARYGAEQVLRLPDNTGYVGGMNAGIARWLARADVPYVLLLTHDTVLAPEALQALVTALESDPHAGLAGPLLFYAGERERVFSAGGRIDRRRGRNPQLRAPLSEATYAVDWIDGCCMLIRREVVEAVGALDDRFFIYFEEVDLCCRAGAAGWSVLVVPRARAWQKKEGLPAPYYWYYNSRNGYLFWGKNFGTPAIRVATGLARRTLGCAAWAVTSALTPGLPRAERASRLRTLGVQLRAAALGTRDHLRGRYGRAREWG